jgi:hypothetical protein
MARIVGMPPNAHAHGHGAQRGVEKFAILQEDVGFHVEFGMIGTRIIEHEYQEMFEVDKKRVHGPIRPR